eukprot:scaffold4613_cov129-Isochrysis_galbana.AAC.14
MEARRADQWEMSALLTRKRAHFDLGWLRNQRALECGERHVALEGLANVLGTLVADFVALKTVRAEQRAATHCQPLLTTKRAHFDLRRWGSERALECDERRVALEGLADVLGAFRANAVVEKTARAIQGGTTNCQPY